MVSFFSVSCTETILVSREHDLDAEAKGIEITMNTAALYCNLNNAEEVDLEKLGAYLSAEERDVVTFVAPATIGTTSFMTWLTEYAGDKWQVLSETNTDGRLVMAALVNNATVAEVSGQGREREHRHAPNPVPSSGTSPRPKPHTAG